MKVGRVVLFFITAFASIIVPVVAVLLYQFLTYEPSYVVRSEYKLATISTREILESNAPFSQAEKVDTTKYPGSVAGFHITLSDHGNVLLLQFTDKDMPKEWLHPVSHQIPTTRVFSSDVTEYTRKDNAMQGLIFTAENWLIKSEAPARDLCYLQLGHIPILQPVGMKNNEAPKQANISLILGIIGIYCIFLLIFWPKMASWAAAIEPDESLQPLPADSLKTQLLALNGENIPFTVEPAQRGTDLIAQWKYTDVQWAGIMAVAGMSNTARIRMRIDEKQQVVRVIDSSLNISWAASGAGVVKASANASWFRGINFYSYDRGMVGGIVISANGKPSLQPAYSWNFNISEMKNPLIRIVVNSGWKWKPVITFIRLFN